VTMLFQIAVALMANEIGNKYYKKFTQSVTFFPYFLSTVVVSSIVYSLLAQDIGVLTRFLNEIGFGNIMFYREPKYWRGILTAVNVWRWVGYGSILFLAAISGIDPTYYEAAIVDGASKIQRMMKITLPMLKPTIIVLLLLQIGGLISGHFQEIYSIVKDNGMLYPTTDTIDTFVFRAMRTFNDFGMATAVGLFQSILGLILVLLSNMLAKSTGDGTSLF